MKQDVAYRRNIASSIFELLVDPSLDVRLVDNLAGRNNSVTSTERRERSIAVRRVVKFRKAICDRLSRFGSIE